MTRTLMTVSILSVLASPASALWGEKVMKCGDDLFRYTKYFSEPKIEYRRDAKWVEYCPNTGSQKFFKTENGGACSFDVEKKMSRTTNSDECYFQGVQCRYETKKVFVPVKITIDFEYLLVREEIDKYGGTEGYGVYGDEYRTFNCVEQ